MIILSVKRTLQMSEMAKHALNTCVLGLSDLSKHVIHAYMRDDDALWSSLYPFYATCDMMVIKVPTNTTR